MIRIGADPFPPYQFEKDGKLTGMDYETVTGAFFQAGLAVQVELDEWPRVEEKFEKGNLRCLFQVQPTETRMQKYLFSAKLRDAVTEIITADPGVDWKDFQELTDSGSLVGTIEGYSYGEPVDQLPGDRKNPYPSQSGLLMAVSEHREKAAVFDRGVRLYLQREAGITNVRTCEALAFPRPLAVMFHAGDAELRDAFNEGLARLEEEGGLEDIRRRWEGGGR